MPDRLYSVHWDKASVSLHASSPQEAKRHALEYLKANAEKMLTAIPAIIVIEEKPDALRPGDAQV
jgi:hypothetical protein